MESSAAVALPSAEIDRRSFSKLVAEHHRQLLAYACAVTSDRRKARELVQDAFVDAWKNVSRFDVTRDFGAWLRGIVRNKWRESHRHAGCEVLLADPELARMEDAVCRWTEAAGRLGVLDRLRECRGKLPPVLAAAVAAYYDDDRPGDEAARHLDINPATLRKRLERAREALRECLERNN